MGLAFVIRATQRKRIEKTVESVIEKIKKLDLHHGDVIVLTSPYHLSNIHLRELTEQLCRAFDVNENKILILDEGIDLKLIRTETLKAELENREPRAMA